jgi:hypothetical protein
VNCEPATYKPDPLHVEYFKRVVVTESVSTMYRPGALCWGYLGLYVFALLTVSSTIVAAGLERISGAM